MKNIIRMTGVLILMIAMCISSCKKEESQPGANPADAIASHSTKVIRLIKNFDKKMKSSFKEKDQIELDSAEWNVEELKN